MAITLSSDLPMQTLIFDVQKIWKNEAGFMKNDACMFESHETRLSVPSLEKRATETKFRRQTGRGKE